MVAKNKNADAPATKKDIADLRIEFKSELNNKINSLREELKADIKGSKNEVLNSQDEIIKKLDDMRTEKLMMLSQSRRQDETITNHEERLVRLEHKVLV